MIVIPIQFIMGLFLAGVGLALMIIVHIARWASKVIKKIRRMR